MVLLVLGLQWKFAFVMMDDKKRREDATMASSGHVRLDICKSIYARCLTSTIIAKQESAFSASSWKENSMATTGIRTHCTNMKSRHHNFWDRSQQCCVKEQ